MQDILLQSTQHNSSTYDQAMSESGQTDRKIVARPKEHKGSHILGWKVSTSINKGKYSVIPQEQWSSTPPEIVRKYRRVSELSKPTSNILHQEIYADLTESARGGLGAEIYGDFWNAFRSILDALSNQSPEEIQIVKDEWLLSSWAYPCKTCNFKLLRCTWDDSVYEITTIRYLWDQAKNLLLLGLKNGDKYFTHPTSYKQGRKYITAWECLNIFLNEYIKTKGFTISAIGLQQTLIKSLKDSSPNGTDSKKLTIQNCRQFPDLNNIYQRGAELFTESGWKEITNHLDANNRDQEKRPQQPIPEVNDIISFALKDFLKIMPKFPDKTERVDIDPFENNPIRRTIATSEFNISLPGNKLNSEYVFATLIYPIIHAEKYQLTPKDINKYLVLLSTVMVLNQYHFVIMAKSPENKSFANDQLWKKEHRYHSIFPFLLTFIPGVSSLASGEDQYTGENINYQALLKCFNLTDRSDESREEYKPELTTIPESLQENSETKPLSKKKEYKKTNRLRKKHLFTLKKQNTILRNIKSRQIAESKEIRTIKHHLTFLCDNLNQGKSKLTEEKPTPITEPTKGNSDREKDTEIALLNMQLISSENKNRKAQQKLTRLRLKYDKLKPAQNS